MTVEQVRAELVRAFAQRVPPGEDEAYNNSSEQVSDESLETRKWFTGRTWQEVLREGVSPDRRSIVHTLAPAGWVYYFPAFASQRLDPDDPAELDEALLTTLTWFADPVLPLLSLDERLAIVHWLESLVKAHDEKGWDTMEPVYALERYWYPAFAEAENQETPDDGS